MQLLMKTVTTEKVYLKYSLQHLLLVAELLQQMIHMKMEKVTIQQRLEF